MSEQEDEVIYGGTSVVDRNDVNVVPKKGCSEDASAYTRISHIDSLRIPSRTYPAKAIDTDSTSRLRKTRHGITGQ